MTNMETITSVFEWIEKEISVFSTAHSQKEVTPHELLDFFSRLKLKANTGAAYARKEVLARELIRQGYEEEDLIRMEG